MLPDLLATWTLPCPCAKILRVATDGTQGVLVSLSQELRDILTSYGHRLYFGIDFGLAFHLRGLQEIAWLCGFCSRLPALVSLTTVWFGDRRHQFTPPRLWRAFCPTAMDLSVQSAFGMNLA